MTGINTNVRLTDELTVAAEVGVFVVTRNRQGEPDKVVGVATTLDVAAILVIDDADFWLDELPVKSSDRELWGKSFRWDDEYRGSHAWGFKRGTGVMRAYWCEEDYGYRVQWTGLTASV